ncbi:MAG TPA: TetR/AcrR family transcriptional regulator [Blastocatellia bacterium]|nr:TetR/AcrR family transcriptional regulator [Blastocatellia bacterium]
MARPSNPEIRERLRKQAVDYVISHGAADLTLRPLAKALKTNARMLIYHFGSREGLMREILESIRERGDALIQEWFGKAKTPPTLAEFLLAYWQRMSDPRMRGVVRLVFELYALALRDPRSYPGVLTDPVRYWKTLAARAGSAPKMGKAEATLLLGATRGLLLDLCATGDRRRVTQALNLLARLLEADGKKRKS